MKRAICLVCFLLGAAGPALAQSTGPQPDQFIALPWAWSGAQTFTEVRGGLPEAVTLTGNDYVAVPADCGKVKALTTGTTPTVHLPNLNVSCTIRFITTAAVSCQFLAVSGGSTINSQNFTHTRGTNAGASVSVEIVTPSTSGAKWNLIGDLTS
jgi:hypothetical protein